MSTENTPQDNATVEEQVSAVETPQEDPVAKLAKEKERAQYIKYGLASLGILTVMGVVAYGVFSGSGEEKAAVVDGVGVSKPRGNTNALSIEETQRRAAADSQEAQQAQQANGSFASNATLGAIPQQNAGFNIQGASTATPPLDLPSNNMQQPIIVQQTPQQSQPQTNPYADYQAKINERDVAFSTDVKSLYEKLAEQFLAGNAGSGESGYKRVSLAPKNKTNNASSTNNGSNITQSNLPAAYTAPAIKAGRAMYAILDTGINTDSGATEVVATIVGGEYHGSRLIGQVRQGRGNIAILFNTLAPQDGRPTLQINAVAMKGGDMTQAMADDVYNHTFSRYTSLAVASLLSGYGKSASQLSGTTVTNGNVTTSTVNTPTDKQIIAGALGELGSNASSEIKRGFDRLPTYVTNAGAEFVVFFTKDSSQSN